MFHVYILYSESFDKYYVGHTKDLQARLLTHNEISENSYTSKYRPWTLKWSLELDTRSTAMNKHKRSNEF